MTPTSTSAASASAFGAEHGGSGVPLGILGGELVAPATDGVIRLESGFAGRVIGEADNPGARPD
jgi:hypothetical protein